MAAADTEQPARTVPMEAAVLADKRALFLVAEAERSQRMTYVQRFSLVVLAGKVEPTRMAVIQGAVATEAA